MDAKKIKKVKRKLKIKNILITLVILILIYNFVYYIFKLPIKNIYITGNDIVNDNIIIEEANLDNYPSFILTTSYNIKKNLSNNPYIKSIHIQKKWWGKIYLEIEEFSPLCIELSTKKVILSNGYKVDNIYNIDEVPILTNDLTTEVYDNFIKKFNLVNKDILLQISGIKYSPVNVDKERFYLSMNDGNYVYITLTKIKRLNKYPEIRSEMQNKHGIIYLDSGNYIELKD